MTLSLLENNVCIYCTYLFLSFTTTIIIDLVLACIYKHIHNLFLFLKSAFLSFFILYRILHFNGMHFDHYKNIIINYV